MSGIILSLDFGNVVLVDSSSARCVLLALVPSLIFSRNGFVSTPETRSLGTLQSSKIVVPLNNKKSIYANV